MTLQISLSEFREFMFEEIPHFFEEITVGNERAFSHHIGNGYYILVLSSISESDTVIRKNDAIRVQLMDADDEIVSTTPHTKRTSGYRDRVAEKINRLLDCSYSDCDGEKRVAIGDYGPYFFCTDDTCDYTESIDI